MAIAYLVQEIRSEFSELRRRPTFGKWNAEGSVQEMDSSSAGKEVSLYAPSFTNLMTSLAVNIRSGGNRGYSRKEEKGYVVMLASILLLKSSRNTANRFARMLGLYLQEMGLKGRAVEVLDGLGVTECVRALDDSKTAVNTRTEVCVGRQLKAYLQVLRLTQPLSHY